MIQWTGESRLDLINFACRVTNAVSYLEIGCNTNEVFDRVHCNYKVGVDPRRGGTHRMTSDTFFETNTEKFDVIFIDGLHYYDQVKKDFKNAYQALTDKGIIIFHDMFPTLERWVVVPEPDDLTTYGCWMGDVWRMGFDLLAMDNISFKLVMIDNGCGFVTKGKQNVKQFVIENTWDFWTNHAGHLPLISYDNLVKSYQVAL
jgi:SAM-dependent methyltransferase